MEKNYINRSFKILYLHHVLLNSSNEEVHDGTAHLGEKFSAFYGTTGFITV